MHATPHDHIVAVHILHNGLSTAHIAHVLSLNHAGHVLTERSHAAYHVLILHPLGIDLSAFRLSLFPCLKHGYMLIESLPAIAMVPTLKPSASIPAVVPAVAAPLPVRVVLLAAVFAQAL